MLEQKNLIDALTAKNQKCQEEMLHFLKVEYIIIMRRCDYEQFTYSNSYRN